MSDEKRAYVRARKGTPARGHKCHWPGCDRDVPAAMWGCYSHWMTLPKFLRDKIWRSYQPGQEISKTPSAAYVEVAREVQAWIEQHLAAASKGKLL